MKQHRGFTLIELLVVSVILATVLAIVAPLGFNQIQRSEAYAEKLKVESILHSAKFYAFINSSEVNIELDGQHIKLYSVRYSQISEHNLNYIFFQKESIYINANGFADKEEVKAFVGARELNVVL